MIEAKIDFQFHEKKKNSKSISKTWICNISFVTRPQLTSSSISSRKEIFNIIEFRFLTCLSLYGMKSKFSNAKKWNWKYYKWKRERMNNFENAISFSREKENIYIRFQTSGSGFQRHIRFCNISFLLRVPSLLLLLQHPQTTRFS